MKVKAVPPVSFTKGMLEVRLISSALLNLAGLTTPQESTEAPSTLMFTMEAAVQVSTAEQRCKLS